jgi:hypothetical protein
LKLILALIQYLTEGKDTEQNRLCTEDSRYLSSHSPEGVFRTNYGKGVKAALAVGSIPRK